ncbi:PEPxxWA-CTERM sorting domain-containing protein [Sandarakinorhabdus sp. DWP1-3-1]|uniref:PEPxxWA-CTERM sorting domain-containing protein n=1 Tax=Sandarakinorhabdus sp. DWP1-3-1 TaxID=2804627 RepID=UPI003CEB46E8
MRTRLVSACLLAATIAATPAAARRTAVDENPDGSQVRYSLGGYCDINGDDCGGGTALGYTVKIGSADAFTNVITHGNGLLTFGRAVDFFSGPEGEPSFQDTIFAGGTPAPASYGIDLVSAGQNVELDFDNVFLQSSRVAVGPFGVIRVEWFTCVRPTSPSTCPESNPQSLTLTPGRTGFTGLFTGGGREEAPGFVIDGVFTSVALNQPFLIPAEITGITFASNVPEPASWALLVIGFGLVGAAVRRRAAIGVPARA